MCAPCHRSKRRSDSRTGSTGTRTERPEDPGRQVLPLHSGPQRQVRLRSLQTRSPHAHEEPPQVSIPEQVPQLHRIQAEVQSHVQHGHQNGGQRGRACGLHLDQETQLNQSLGHREQQKHLPHSAANQLCIVFLLSFSHLQLSRPL